MTTGLARSTSIAAVALLAYAAACGAQDTTESPRDRDTSAMLAGLPLTWVAPAAPASTTVAVLITGDGGWAPMVRRISAQLAEAHVAVVALNARAFLSSRKDPETTALAVAVMARAALARWRGTRFVLVGYSRGADLAPFVVTRLPRDVRDRLTGVFMFGLGRSAGFQFHWADLVTDVERPGDLPVAPELARLRGTPMVCAFGARESRSGCRDAPADLLRRIALPGGHDFNGDAQALADIVLRGVNPG